MINWIKRIAFDGRIYWVLLIFYVVMIGGFAIYAFCFEG